MRIDESQDASLLRPLLERWLKICHGSKLSSIPVDKLVFDDYGLMDEDDEFGLTVSVEGVEQDLQARLDLGDGTLLLAWDGVEPVGFFAVFKVKSSLSDQFVAIETFWFAVPNHQLAGPALFHRAKLWAKDNGCTHLIVSASRLASDLHDKVASFCERVGMKPFETVFISEVA